MSAAHTNNNAIPAPLWRRLAAIAYDSFLVLAIMFLVGFINLGIQIYIYGEEQLKVMTEAGHSIGGIFFYLTLFLFIFSFFAYCWTRRGQTLGMQAWNLTIVNNDGKMISMKQSLIRWVTAIPAISLGCIGLLWCLIDREKRTWQDIISGSKTLHLVKK